MAFNRNKTLTKAQKLLQKGKTADAIKEYQIVVDHDPSDVRTLLKIGDLQAKVGNVEAACDTYHQVGEHYSKDGFFLKAVAVFKQILKLDPGLIAVYLRLAELYQQLGLNSEAMKQYQIVVKHYENQGLKKESLDVLKKMAELDPENTASRIKLAELYAKEGHREASIEQFKAVADDLQQKRNYQDLARVYDKMESVGVSEIEMQLEHCEILLKNAEGSKALAKLEALFQTDSKNAKVLELLARTFIELQQPEKAKSIYSELVGVYEQAGRAEEKDRVLGKLRTLGVNEPSAPAVSGVPEVEVSSGEADLLDELQMDDVVELEPEKTSVEMKSEDPVDEEPEPVVELTSESELSDAEVSEPAKESGTGEVVVIQEIEVFMKYGLIDKACESLSKMILADPGNGQILSMLVQAYEAKKDQESLVNVLEQAQKAVATKGLPPEATTPIIAEIEKIRPSAAPEETAAAVAEPEPESFEDIELEIVDDESPQEEASFERPEASQEEDQFEISEADLDSAIDIDISTDMGEDLVDSEPVLSNESAEPVLLEDSIVEEAVEELVIEDAPEELSSEAEPEPTPEPAEEELVMKEESASEPEEAQVSQDPDEEFLAPAAAEIENDFGTELEEAAFFVQEGLIEEAREIYEGILEVQPENATALEKLEEIKAVEPEQSDVQFDTGEPERRKTKRKSSKEVIEDVEPEQDKGTSRFLKEATSQQQEKSEDSGGGDLFDLGAELQDEIHDLEEDLSKKPSADDEDYLSPAEVIMEFKKGVSRTVAKDDYQTHYNLGIAYKEMGLLNEAIQEFDIAAGDAKRAVDCGSMIGLCLIGKKDFEAAIDVYRKALGLTKPTSEEALGLSYELAEAYIGHGNLAEAYKLFARVRDVDPSFRDAQRRARELEADLGPAAPPPSAVEKADEKDESVVEIARKKNKISYI